ncbi:MAG: hypothetical protein KC502_23135, partial [Myxococcales bacterium]|nr:hypothetical protein [Myxococcales bacterium]
GRNYPSRRAPGDADYALTGQRSSSSYSGSGSSQGSSETAGRCENGLGGVTGMQLGKYDAKGGQVWARNHRYLGEFSLVPLRNTLGQVGDGGVVVVARENSPYGNRSVVVRPDASGHTSYRDAGKCAHNKDPSCDDNNARTTD